MENHRIVIVTIFLLGFCVYPVQAYSPDTTHLALTDEVVDLFNFYYPQYFLSDTDKNALLRGSHDEDGFGRWMFHFYDPIYNQGAKFAFRWSSSKKWAQDHKLQAKMDPKMLVASRFLTPFSGKTDYSWERSIYEYAWGDKERGLKGLGQILHLIEDLSVPAHTRDDPHPPILSQESVYEMWTDQFDRGDLNLANELKYKNPPLYKNLDDYFDSLANYSNSNFFSSDTIFKKRYNNPQIDFKKRELLSDGKEYLFGYRAKSDKGQFRLIQIKKGRSWEGIEYSLKDNDNLILTDYWKNLSREAVLHGAGVIRLFFYEVEKEKISKKLLTYNQNTADKLIAAATSLFSPTKKLQQEGVLDENLDFIDSETVSEPEPPVVATKITFKDSTLKPPRVAELKDVIDPPKVLKDVTEPSKGDKIIKEKERSKKRVIYYGGVGGGRPAVNADTSDSQEDNNDSPSQDNPDSQDDLNPPEAPVITSPSNNSIFTSTTILFSGTATSGVTILNDFSTATTSAGSLGEWTLSVEEFNQGTTTVSFYTENKTGTSSSTLVTIYVDSEGPDLSNFKAEECNDSLADNGCLLSSNTINLSWSSAEDAQEYEITCSTCGGDFSKNTSATSTDFTVQKEGVHTFTLKSEDDLGNETTLSSQQIEINSKPVVINEIAWMGTGADTSDEWIELFNTSSFDILLGTSTATTTWQIESEDGTPNINLEGFINSKSFFLLERTASTTTSIAEDQTYTGSLKNNGEALTLKDPRGNSVDLVDAVFYKTGWFAGDNTTKQTMERISPYGDSVIYNWKTASTTASTTSAFDAENNPILGTPRKQNSVYSDTWRLTFIEDHTLITSDEVWSPNHSPYILETNSGESPTVDIGSTLTIEAGTIIMALPSPYSALKIEGSLIVEGKEDNEVIFTLYDDEDYEGSTKGEKGKWKGIEFTSSSSGSEINYARFRYGGAGTPPKNLVDIEPGGEASFNNCLFEENKGLIFSLEKNPTGGANDFSGVVIENSQFNNNGILGLAGDAAIKLEGVIGPTITSNNFLGNNYSPIKTISSYSDINSNTASNNFYNGIYVDDNTIIESDTTWSASLPYILQVNKGERVTVASTTTLTINPNVIMKTFSGSLEAFRVEGGLVWNPPGVFTSLYDDEYGGDTNNDATSTEPSVGDWRDFHFTASSTGSISGIDFLYGTEGSSTTTPGVVVDEGAVVSF